MINSISFKTWTFETVFRGWMLAVSLAAPLLLAAPGEVEMVTEDLPWAVVDRAYSPAPLDVRVTGRCPAGGVGFAIASGALPPGLKLSRLGYFSGVPTRTGLFGFTVRAENGCGSANRGFGLLVTDPPKLKIAPEQLAVTSKAGENLTDTAIHLTANWPQLAYLVNVVYGEGGSNWLSAVPEHGMTSKESIPRRLADVPSDEIAVRFHASELKAGRYEAQVSVSAWQAEPVALTVILTVEESAVDPHP
jgi:hypothetical protein